MKVLGLIGDKSSNLKLNWKNFLGIILLGILVHPGKTYDPGTLCLYQTSTFYERFGLEYAYRIINRRVAAKVYLIHNTSSMWVDKEIVKHQNDVMMLIVGRTSKMFHLHEQLEIKHPVTDFELTGSQINDGYEPFLEWASKYVPSYDVGNETTLPPFMLLEDSTNEENFADQFMLAKYPYDPVNYTSSNESLSRLVTQESESVIQKWVKREYRSEKKMEKGKRITMFVKDIAENDAEIDEQEDLRQGEKDYDNREDVKEEEERENNDLKPVRTKKTRRAKGYRMQYTRKSTNGMLYARMMRGYDWFRQPYRVESWPRPVYRASRAKRVRNQNVQRYSCYNPRNDAQFQQVVRPYEQKAVGEMNADAHFRRVVRPYEQKDVREMNAVPRMHVFSHGAVGVVNQHVAQLSAAVKTRKVKAANKVRNTTKAKRPRAIKTVKSAAKAIAKPAIKTAVKSIVKAGMKSVAKSAAKSAVKTAVKSVVKTAAKSAVKIAAKSAVKTAAKSAVKTAARSAVRKSNVKTAGKSVAKNAAQASAKDTNTPKVAAKGRKRKPTTSTLIGYITYMEPGPFIPYINNKVAHNGPQMAVRPQAVARMR